MFAGAAMIRRWALGTRHSIMEELDGVPYVPGIAPMSALPFSRYFPPVETATPEGLLCIGGELAPDWLLDAYRHGIFPWPIFDDQEILAWWSPDPRAVFEFDGLYVSRRLARTCRSEKFRVTCNRDFNGVIRGCANAGARRFSTWLTPSMIAAYTELHRLGHAHSVETWHAGELAGGIYGIAIGGLFAGESMFYRVRDASKVALVSLVEHLAARGYRLFDIQQFTEHSASLGAIEISRRVYLQRLRRAVDLPVCFGDVLESQRNYF